MNPETTRRIRETAEAVVSRLARGDFESLESDTQGIRLTASMMRDAIADYRRTVIDRPHGEDSGFNIIQIDDAVPAAYAVDIDLWTAEEGRSDLTLELRLIENGNSFRIEIDNLHVM